MLILRGLRKWAFSQKWNFLRIPLGRSGSYFQNFRRSLWNLPYEPYAKFLTIISILWPWFFLAKIAFFNEKLVRHIWQTTFSAFLEAIVLPGKIPATCAGHADRGAVKSGLYEIKPSVDVDPFFVTCDFRNCCRKTNQKRYEKTTQIYTKNIFANFKTVPKTLLPSSNMTKMCMESRQYLVKRTAATVRDVTKTKSTIQPKWTKLLRLSIFRKVANNAS